MTPKNQPEIPNDDVEHRLWRLLKHTAFMINRNREKELAQFGITPEQTQVLDILHKSGGTSTIQDIVNITMRQHHSISTLLNRMALQGLVKKNRSKYDARQYNVMITLKGQTLYSKITTNSITDIFSALSPRDRKGLYIKLTKLMIKAYKALGKKYQPNIMSD